MDWSLSPVLGARDVRSACDYYCAKLGFTCPDGVFSPAGDESGGVYAILHRDGIVIHLQIRRREVYQMPRERIESDAYFYVGDADRLFEEFRQSGAKIFREPEDGPTYGLRDFVVEDLDGNRLLFGSPKSP